MCRCQQAAFILSKYMWLVEKSTSYGVLPTQKKKAYCVRSDITVSEGIVSKLVLMRPTPPRKGKPAMLLERGITQLYLNLQRSCFFMASVKQFLNEPAVQVQNLHAEPTQCCGTDTILQAVAPAENPTPSYSLATTSWRFLPHNQQGGSNEHSISYLRQKRDGAGRADHLWTGETSS